MTTKLYLTAGSNGGIWIGKPNTETSSGVLTKEASGTTETLYQATSNASTATTYKIIIVGEAGGIFLSNRTGDTTSTWAKVHQDSNPLYACAYGNGVWIAAGDNNTILSSPDGTTWTARTSPIENAFWRWAEFGAGKFIIVGGATSNTKGYIISSTDGITWTRQDSGVNQTLQAVAYSPELNIFAVVGNNGTILTGNL
jgi:hypothetical protein